MGKTIKNKSKIRQRREQGAVCPNCKSPDYSYLGRANVSEASNTEELEYWSKYGKHSFKCKSCGNYWQYGNSDCIYLELL